MLCVVIMYFMVMSYFDIYEGYSVLSLLHDDILSYKMLWRSCCINNSLALWDSVGLGLLA